MSIRPYVSYHDYLNNPHLHVNDEEISDTTSNASNDSTEEVGEEYPYFPNLRVNDEEISDTTSNASNDSPEEVTEISKGAQFLAWLAVLWEFIKACFTACFSSASDIPKECHESEMAPVQDPVGRFELSSDYW
jgi:hypothetical protein